MFRFGRVDDGTIEFKATPVDATPMRVWHCVMEAFNPRIQADKIQFCIACGNTRQRSHEC